MSRAALLSASSPDLLMAQQSERNSNQAKVALVVGGTLLAALGVGKVINSRKARKERSAKKRADIAANQAANPFDASSIAPSQRVPSTRPPRDGLISGGDEPVPLAVRKAQAAEKKRAIAAAQQKAADDLAAKKAAALAAKKPPTNNTNNNNGAKKTAAGVTPTPAGVPTAEQRPPTPLPQQQAIPSTRGPQPQYDANGHRRTTSHDDNGVFQDFLGVYAANSPHHGHGGSGHGILGQPSAASTSSSMAGSTSSTSVSSSMSSLPPRVPSREAKTVASSMDGYHPSSSMSASTTIPSLSSFSPMGWGLPRTIGTAPFMPFMRPHSVTGSVVPAQQPPQSASARMDALAASQSGLTVPKSKAKKAATTPSSRASAKPATTGASTPAATNDVLLSTMSIPPAKPAPSVPANDEARRQREAQKRMQKIRNPELAWSSDDEEDQERPATDDDDTASVGSNASDASYTSTGSERRSVLDRNGFGGMAILASPSRDDHHYHHNNSNNGYHSGTSSGRSSPSLNSLQHVAAPEESYIPRPMAGMLHRSRPSSTTGSSASPAQSPARPLSVASSPMAAWMRTSSGNNDNNNSPSNSNNNNSNGAGVPHPLTLSMRSPLPLRTVGSSSSLSLQSPHHNGNTSTPSSPSISPSMASQSSSSMNPPPFTMSGFVPPRVTLPSGSSVTSLSTNGGGSTPSSPQLMAASTQSDDSWVRPASMTAGAPRSLLSASLPSTTSSTYRDGRDAYGTSSLTLPSATASSSYSSLASSSSSSASNGISLIGRNNDRAGPSAAQLALERMRAAAPSFAASSATRRNDVDYDGMSSGIKKSSSPELVDEYENGSNGGNGNGSNGNHSEVVLPSSLSRASDIPLFRPSPATSSSSSSPSLSLRAR